MENNKSTWKMEKNADTTEGIRTDAGTDMRTDAGTNMRSDASIDAETDNKNKYKL